jgi:16S rRNA (guanine527-N7)-methyltransferase
MQLKLIQNASKMGVVVNQLQSEQLIQYLTLIIKWNKTYNLSAIRNLEEGLNKHLLDSLSIVPYISNKRLLDIGSGAGLPGIVLAIMLPQLSVTVLDSVGKKCRFMQFIKAQLQLNNLSVVNARLENYQPETCFEQITSRAFASIEKTLDLSADLLCDNGKYLLMKGANINQEPLPKSAKIHQLSVPEVSDRRFLITIGK